MSDYQSSYTGAEIDAGISKANTAIQEHQDISGKQNISTLEADVKMFINRSYIEGLISNGDEVSY